MLLALHGGLYEGDFNEKTYLNFGIYTRASFVAFAEMIGINPAQTVKVVDEFMLGTLKAMEFVECSFLSNEAKKKYIKILGDRHRCLGLRGGGDFLYIVFISFWFFIFFFFFFFLFFFCFFLFFFFFPFLCIFFPLFFFLPLFPSFFLSPFPSLFSLFLPFFLSPSLKTKEDKVSIKVSGWNEVRERLGGKLGDNVAPTYLLFFFFGKIPPPTGEGSYL